MRSKLRVGLLLDGAVVVLAARTIEGSSAPLGDIVLAVVDGALKDIDPIRATESFLYDTYIWFDRRKNGRRLDPLAAEDIPPDLDKASRVYLRRTTEARRFLSEEVVRKIHERDLDVMIDIGNVTPLGELSRCARHGVWSFSPGDGVRYDSSSPGFWEIFHREPVTCAHVRRIVRGSTSIIYLSRSHTITTSEKRNRDQLYLKGISFLPRLLDMQYALGKEPLPSLDVGTVTAQPSLRRNGPGNLDMMSYYIRRLPRDARLLSGRALFEERWAVQYSLDSKIPSSYDGFHQLMPPKHTWWGDPQAAQQDDDYYIFIEELALPRSHNHARISVISSRRHGRGPVPVLERPYRVYPFVFEWKGSHYMVPESSNNRTIELYEAEVPVPLEVRQGHHDQR